MIHLGTVRRAAKLVEISRREDGQEVVLRSGSLAKVKFRFANPEFLTLGKTMVFREGVTKGVGRIVAIC